MILFLIGCGSTNTGIEAPDQTARDDRVSSGVGSGDQNVDPDSRENGSDTQGSGGSDSAGANETTPLSPGSAFFNNISAAGLVADIRIGWSLGNTLDAHGGPDGFPHLGGGIYANTTVTELELAWGRPQTTQEHFDAVKKAGFDAIRIPVTWYKACDADLNIRDDWMARVQEIVDYAVVNDMYIIVNTHHDDILFRLPDDEIEESKKAIVKIWEQIAVTFRDYNEKLIFESLGEPRTAGTAAEWRGGTPEEHNNLNILNQLFVDTVRSTGGNNAERVLVIPTYAASANEVAQRALVIPDDTAEGKIAVTLHFYEPWNFALRTGEGSVPDWSADSKLDTDPITRYIDLAYEVFVSKGIPVIIGEMGAVNRDNIEARAAWSEFYTAYAKSKGMTCFWWDNGSYWVLRRRDWGWEQTFGLLDRETFEIAHPEIVEALLRGTS